MEFILFLQRAKKVNGIICKMRILLVNNTLNSFSGTELYTLDLAKSLIALGHKPIAYSTDLGHVAEKLRAEGIPVTNDLRSLGAKPDVIHGHHHLDTLTALLHFTDVPAIYFCHGWLPWQEAPLSFPRIYKYVAVCDLSAERLIVEGGIAPEHIHLLLNFVDLERFKQRKCLSDKPKKALAFSSFMNKERVHLIETACRQCGIKKLDKIGLHIGKTHLKPEDILGEYDIIFAKGRAALEALATGAAVISCDGAGSMVTTENLERQRMANFGLSERHYPYNIDTITNEIRKYNHYDAEKVSNLIRLKTAKEAAVNNIVNLYNEVIETHINTKTDNVKLELQAVSNYLRWLRIDMDKGIPSGLTLKQKLMWIGKKILKNAKGLIVK